MVRLRVSSHLRDCVLQVYVVVHVVSVDDLTRLIELSQQVKAFLELSG